MAQYEDDMVVLDDDGVTIKNYRRRGDAKRIAYGDIRDIDVFEMGIWSGRYRLVGISFGRPRNWFHWNPNLGAKGAAIGLDVGKWIRPTMVPEDPATVEEILRARIGSA